MCGAIWEMNLRSDLRDVVVVSHEQRNLVVAVIVFILGPCVELPVGDGKIALGVFDEDGSGVAEPDAVGGPVVEVEAGEVGSGTEEDTANTFFCGFIVDEDVDVFDLREVTGDFGIDPGDGLEFSGLVFGVVRPRDPSGGVRGPFGRHAVAGRSLFGAQWVPPARTFLCKVFD